MARKLLTERMALTGGTVTGTPEAPIITGVLLCGATSANRRRYLRKAFEGGRVGRYNGVPVNLNHGTGRDNRGYQEQIGTVQNARLRADGMPIGDIHVNPKKLHAEAFLWDARHQPKACGMSHVAHCETRVAADGWDDVTELVRVESVDVISAGKAATTKGLYESEGKTVALTVKQLAEALVRHPKTTFKQLVALKRLGEMDGMDTAPAMMDAPPDMDAAEPDVDDAMMSAFKSAIGAVVDQAMSGTLDPKAALSKIKSLLASHASVNDDGTPDSDSDPATTDGDDAPGDTTDESKKPTLSTLIAECKAAGYAATTDDLSVLTEIASPKARAAYVERLKVVTEGRGAEQPKSGGRVKQTKPAKAPATLAELRESYAN